MSNFRPDTDPHEWSGDQDELLIEAIEEFSRAQERDSSLTIDQFANRYPDIRNELIGCLKPFKEFSQTELAPNEAQESTEGIANNLGSLGDFRLLAEIGRGAMGIVYRAEQISIGRLVAVKTLPLAAILDTEHIERFKNETRAAGNLHHDNIVPVLSVGEERGVYYYAMKLVDGVNLAEAFENQNAATESSDGSPTGTIEVDLGINSTDVVNQALEDTWISRPTPKNVREIARIGADVAKALEHAHVHGILHRDIKPSNLMLDKTGKAWVTDFGLARLDSQSALTRTGDVVGTLRYVPPEALESSSNFVDHRCDIYALGLTLYELLTGRKAFNGQRKEQLVRQILLEEPPRLRTLDSTIPLDLQTIVEKATAKEARARYASAAAMAADLEAFLESSPIRAKPLGIGARLARLKKRYAVAIYSVAFATLSCTLIACVLLWQEAARTDSALQTANANADKAEANLDTTLQLLDKLALAGIAEPDVYREKFEVKEQSEFAHKVIETYEELYRLNPNSETVAYSLAIACSRVARLESAYGDNQHREAMLDRAILLFSQLSELHQKNGQYQVDLARALMQEFDVESLTLAIELLSELHAESPTDVQVLEELAVAHNRRGGKNLNAGAHATVEADFQSCQHFVEKLSALAPSNSHVAHGLGLGNYASFLVQQGRTDEALGLAHRKLKITEAVLALNENDAKALFRRGGAAGFVGHVHSVSRDYNQACSLYRRAIEDLEEVCRRYPGYAYYTRMFTLNAKNYVGNLRRTDRNDEIEAFLSGFFERLPKTPFTLTARGMILAELDRPEEALHDLNEALALQPTYSYALSEKAKVLIQLEELD